MALQRIDEACDHPFLLNLWFHTPHTPIEGPTALVERYRKKLRPEMRQQNPDYVAMVQSLDDNIGRLLDRLDQRGLSNRTLIVFTSNNSGYIGKFNDETLTSNHSLRSGKGSLYEGGIRVPLIVRWPGVVRAETTSSEPVFCTDHYWTLIEAATQRNDQPAQSIDGQSLIPLFRGEATLDRKYDFFHLPITIPPQLS